MIPLDATGQVDLSSLEVNQKGAVELLRVRATTTMAHYEPVPSNLNDNPPAGAIKGHRDVIWGQVSDHTPLYTWEALRPGQSISGGAILESAWTTYPVPPGWTLRVDEYANGHLTRRE